MAAIIAIRREVIEWQRKQKDLGYLAIQVAFTLERFGNGCAEVADDDGYSGWRLDTMEPELIVDLPTFEPELLKVEWKTLSPTLLYDVLDLPVKIGTANGFLSAVAEHQDVDGYVFERQLEYAKLGVIALQLADDIREQGGLKAREWRFRDNLDHLKTTVASLLEKQNQAQQRNAQSGFGLLLRPPKLN